MTSSFRGTDGQTLACATPQEAAPCGEGRWPRICERPASATAGAHAYPLPTLPTLPTLQTHSILPPSDKHPATRTTLPGHGIDSRYSISDAADREARRADVL